MQIIDWWLGIAISVGGFLLAILLAWIFSSMGGGRR